MKYNLLSVLISWVFPTRRDRNKFRKFCESIDNRAEIKKAQKRYICVANSIKKSQKTKIKVLFLVNENSKWKTQSLYDLLEKSEKFEPVIALTIADRQKRASKEEKKKCLEENFEFFKTRNMTCVYAWDIEKNKAKNLNIFKPQFVFYQQPWFLPKIQQPKNVSKFALTCYVPYFVPNYGIMNMDCSEFHKFLYRNYVLNKDWENLYKNYIGEDYTGNIVSVGHTMLDDLYLKKDIKNDEDYVIYAPHWSIPCQGNKNDENYATFLWTGKIILNYAKNHPEINWVFKPHPTLKVALKRTGFFSNSDIENYYKEWETVAKPFYSANYMEIFMKSKALITDCGSFLIEYFCTGKPIIHLISDQCSAIPPEPTQKIFNTFYQVKNAGELYNQLENLLQRNNDYKQEERLRILKDLNLENCYAAQNIINDLEKIIAE